MSDKELAWHVSMAQTAALYHLRRFIDIQQRDDDVNYLDGMSKDNLPGLETLITKKLRTLSALEDELEARNLTLSQFLRD